MSNLIHESSSPISNLVDEFYPINEPLVAKYKRGFGFKTIGYRLPVILTKVIDQLSRDKNDIGDKLGQEARAEVKEVVGALAKLKNEMTTNKSMQPTNSNIWNAYLEQTANTYFNGNKEDARWYVSPWLHVECYMYHRMNDSLKSTKYLQKYDPFVTQKQEAFFTSVEASNTLAEFLSSSEVNSEFLQTLLEISLWGNRCDLSISQGEDNSQTSDIVQQLASLRDNILANDSSLVWDTLNNVADKRTNDNPRVVGYILDNSAFELVTDLCFADALLESKLVDRIDLYVKTEPWFISDALLTDVLWLIETMKNVPDKPILNKLGSKWMEYVNSGRITIVEREFWTYPHAYWEMQKADPSLYSELSSKSLLIFKGDLNYRKLIGDINWEFDTSFVKSLQGFTPAPLIALRTLKADCVSGLPRGVGEKLSEEKHDWMTTGEYGLIQFAQ